MSTITSLSVSDRSSNFPELSYNPQEYPREIARHYISATVHDIEQMLGKVGAESLKDIFSHLPEDIRFSGNPEMPAELSYRDATVRLHEIAGKTNLLTSFIGDLLPAWKVHPIVNEV